MTFELVSSNSSHTNLFTFGLISIGKNIGYYTKKIIGYITEKISVIEQIPVANSLDSDIRVSEYELQSR